MKNPNFKWILPGGMFSVYANQHEDKMWTLQLKNQRTTRKRNLHNKVDTETLYEFIKLICDFTPNRRNENPFHLFRKSLVASPLDPYITKPKNKKKKKKKKKSGKHVDNYKKHKKSRCV